MRGVSRSLLLMALAALLILPPPVPGSGNGRATPPPSNGDWIVADDTSISSTAILLNGSLVVQPTGTLRLTNVTLTLNCSYPGQFRIEVQTGGELRFIGCELGPVNGSRGFLFWALPGSVLEISGSSVRGAGTAASVDGTTNGVLVRTNNALIRNSTFSDSFEALHARDCSLTVSDCIFQNNDAGIVAHNCTLQVRDCVFLDGNASGLSVYDNTVATVTGCNFTRNFRYGMYVNRSLATATDNTFFQNYIGFHAEYSNGSQVRRCSFQNEDYIGLRFWQCPQSRVYDCKVGNRPTIALFSMGSRVNAVNTTLNSSMYDAYLDGGALVELVNCSLSNVNLFFKDDASRLNLSWFLNIKVLWWSNETPVPGASVSVSDQGGNQSFKGTTDVQGRLDWGVVPGYTMTRTVYRIFGPYTATAQKGGLASSATTGVNRSMELRMLLDDIGPAFQIDYPLQGAFINSSYFTIRGTAWDNETAVSRIDVSIDNGSWLPANGTASWDFRAGLPDGLHKALIRGRDTANNTNIAFLSFSVDTVGPMLNITSPADGNMTRETNVTVTGFTEPDGNASVTVNGTTAPVDNSTGAYEAVVNLTEGNNLIPVIAVDRAGNIARIDLHMRQDTIVTPFEIFPHNGSWFNHSVININGTVEESSVLTIRAIDAQGNSSGEMRINITTGNFSVNYTLRNGTNLMRIEAVDGAGNSASEDLVLTLDRTPPVVNVTSPPTAEYYTRERRIVISGSVDKEARLYINGWPVPFEDGYFNKSYTLDPGLNAFTLTAVDNAGNVRTVKLNAYLDRVPPSLIVKTPKNFAHTSTGSILVKGITEQCATVYINGERTKVAASGSFSRQVPLRMGNNSIDVIAYDRAGNPASVHLVVDRGATPALLSDWQIALLTIVIIVCAFAGVVVWDTRKATGKWGLRRPDWFRVPDRIKAYVPKPTFGREEFESGHGAVQDKPRKEAREPPEHGAPAPGPPAQPPPQPAGAAQGARLGDEFIVSQKPLSAQPASMPAPTEVPSQLSVAEPAPGAAAAIAPVPTLPGVPAPTAPAPPAAAVAEGAAAPPGAPATPSAGPAGPAWPPAPAEPPKPKEPLDPLAEILGHPTKKL